MLIGLIKWFNEEKGFGLIGTPDQGDFFLHVNNLHSKSQNIYKGRAVVFEKEFDDEKNRPIAINCRLIGEPNDFPIIMNYLGKRDRVDVMVEASQRGRKRSVYYIQVPESRSLMYHSTKQLLGAINAKEAANVIIDYFDKNLDKKLFITYCEFIDNLISKIAKSEKAVIFLKHIYTHFGNNMNEEMLFHAWKRNSLKFVSYTDDMEYEIPERLFRSFWTEIGVPEMKRIINYEFGSSFSAEFIDSKFKDLDKLAYHELDKLYPYLKFAGQEESLKLKPMLDKLCLEKTLKEIVKLTDKLGIIKNTRDLSEYEQIIQSVISFLEDHIKATIQNECNKILAKKCSEEFKPELWIKGIIKTAPFECISKTFHDKETQFDKRITILSKLNPSETLELLKAFSAQNDWEESFEILANLPKKENLLNFGSELSEIRNQIIGKFSFKGNNNLGKLRELFTQNPLNDLLRNNLRANLISEKTEISVGVLFEVFTNLKDYGIIENENNLLELLIGKTLWYNELSDLISLLTNDCETRRLRKIVLSSREDISSWEKFELIGTCGLKNKLAIVLIDVFLSQKNEYSELDIDLLVDYLKESDNEKLRLDFFDKLYEKFSPKYPDTLIELAILSNQKNAQKISYQNLEFNTENDILNFIDKAKTLNLSDDVKATNKPLTGFLEFINSTSCFELTEDCKKFFQINTGFVQCLSVKYLVYQLHKKSINKAKLIEILNSFQWTEISALLVKTFIEASNHTEKIILDKLSGIFKSHFEIISSHNFHCKLFLENFTVHNILKKCNGRKFYNGELWQRNEISRWYVSGNVSLYTHEEIDCYCEGRPWKKETFWDSRSNKPLNEKHEKYWCKTSYCAARNDSIDLNLPYHKWTLSEISQTLNIKVEKIALATLAGWANRMNQIVERLFCRECHNVLRPLPFRPGSLGYYAVPLFHCINNPDECSESGKRIRFTHCLNGKCVSHKTSEPLDSRDCVSCKPNDPNHIGLKCNYCGSNCPACSGQYNRIKVDGVW